MQTTAAPIIPMLMGEHRKQIISWISSVMRGKRQGLTSVVAILQLKRIINHFVFHEMPFVLLILLEVSLDLD